MNSLRLLGVLALVALAVAWDSQEDSSLSEEMASSRLVRSPEARQRGRAGRQQVGDGEGQS